MKQEPRRGAGEVGTRKMSFAVLLLYRGNEEGFRNPGSLVFTGGRGGFRTHGLLNVSPVQAL
jgi:hypothetical protein